MAGIYSVKSTYNENLFYHRAMALKADKAAAKKKSALGDLEVLDLSLLREVKRSEKGAVEIKLIDRIQALEQLMA